MVTAPPRPEPRVAAAAQQRSRQRPEQPRPAPQATALSAGDGLGGVDRLTMNFYAQSLRHADAEKRGRLARTHGAFSARLAACGSDSCRRSAYLERNGEISRIMMGE